MPLTLESLQTSLHLIPAVNLSCRCSSQTLQCYPKTLIIIQTPSFFTAAIPGRAGPQSPDGLPGPALGRGLLQRDQQHREDPQVGAPHRRLGQGGTTLRGGDRPRESAWWARAATWGSTRAPSCTASPHGPWTPGSLASATKSRTFYVPGALVRCQQVHLSSAFETSSVTATVE
jgi:hypothetical protein